MEFHIESMTQELAAREGCPCRTLVPRLARKFWQYDTTIGKKLAPPGSHDGMSDLTQDLRQSFRGMRA